MKRNMDLIRTVLLRAEEHPNAWVRDEMKIDGYTAEEIGFHIHLMMEAGLVKGCDLTTLRSSGPEASLSSVTWAGYEFLDSIRSQTVWDKVKAKASLIGGASLPIIVELATGIAKDQLGLK